MKAKVYIQYKEGILEPQGQAIRRSLQELGYNECCGARVGKVIVLDLEEKDPVRAKERVDGMCKVLLANPVIEDYQIELLK